MLIILIFEPLAAFFSLYLWNYVAKYYGLKPATFAVALSLWSIFTLIILYVEAIITGNNGE